MTEFNLSEFIYKVPSVNYDIEIEVLTMVRVKEFIRLLKEYIENEDFTSYEESRDGEMHECINTSKINDYIDKLVGDKLK